MPYRRTYKGRAKRYRKSYTYRSRKGRKIRPKRRYARALSTIGRGWKNPFPRMGYIKFKYIDNAFDLSTAAASSYRTKQVFRANSLYDPDFTGVGVQPYGFDQHFPAIYDVYNVRGSKIVVNIAITSATCSQLRIYIIPFRTDSVTNNDVSDLRLIPGCRYRVFSKAEGTTRKNYIKNYRSTKKIINYVKDDRDEASSYNTNPSIPWYWIVIADTGDALEEVDIVADVKIVYYTRCTATTVGYPES